MNRPTNNKRIAKNTMYMYLRMIIVMIVTLYTSRVVLEALGVEDFGIYNVVGGIIAMFRILNGALSDASQRFITYELGKGDKGNVSGIFSQCLWLHFLLGIIVVIVAEPIGLWFLNNKLLIPVERLDAAFWIYQFTVISMFTLLISVPYNAMIVAHEKMKAFAAISIVDVFVKLGVAFALYVHGVDKLILYGLLMLVAQIIMRVTYSVYCKRNIPSCRYSFTWDKKTLVEMGQFASWTILGNMAYLCTTQGVNLLLGMFFNPIVNAARGIAVQVQSAVETFVRNFQTAINPQITKNCASGDIESMRILVFTSSRLSFFLMMLPIFPLLFETETILQVWLGQVPKYAVSFTRIILLISWVSALLNPLEVSVKASGKIRNFEIVIYGLKLLVVPLAYWLLYEGMSPIYVFILQFVIELIAWIASIYISSKDVGFNTISYIKEVVVIIVPVITVSLIIPLTIVYTIEESVCRFVVTTILSCLWSVIVVYLLGTTKTEKEFIQQKVIWALKIFSRK